MAMTHLNPQNLEKLILRTVKDMSNLYQRPGKFNDHLKTDSMGWSDGWGTQGLISTGEALEGLFIPYWILPGYAEIFWAGKIVDLEIVRDSLRYLVDGYQTEQGGIGTLGLPGTPYIDFRQKYLGGTPSQVGRNYDFIDTACFLVCALLDAKAIDAHFKILTKEKRDERKPLIDPEIRSRLDQRIINCLKLLRDCDVGPGQGWTFTNDTEEKPEDRTDFLYFTWNALEAIEVVVQQVAFLPPIPPEITGGEDPKSYYKTLLTEKLGGLTARYLSPSDSPDKYICGPDNPVTFDKDSSYYYNLFALQGLITCGSKETELLVKSLGFLLSSMENEKIAKNILKENHGKFILSGTTFGKHGWQWGERAFIPMMAKAIARVKESGGDKFAGKLTPSRVGNSKSLEEWMEEYLTKVESMVLDEAKVGEKLSLWDTDRYSIYYTERVIEALCRVYAAFFPEQVAPAWREVKGTRPGKVEGVTAGAAFSGLGEGSPIQVNVVVSAEVIQDALKTDLASRLEGMVREIVEDRLKSMVEKKLEELTKVTPLPVSQQDSTDVRKDVRGALSLEFLDLANDLEADKSRSSKHAIADRLAAVLGYRLEHALFKALEFQREGKQKIDRDSFVERLSKALALLAAREEAAQAKNQEIDYLGIMKWIFEHNPPKPSTKPADRKK